MQFAFVLLSLLPLAYSLECYKDLSKNFRNPPENIVTCPANSRYCLSQAVAGTHKITFECDDETFPVCQRSGCTINNLGEKMCCCHHDRCNYSLNSASKLLAAASLLLPLILRV